MTTEDDFQAALDANPEDWQTRLVFADWLDERGDERAAGYRALGRGGYHPHFSQGSMMWVFWNSSCYAKCNRQYPELFGKYVNERPSMLPADWFVAARGAFVNFYRDPSRTAVEDAAATAFARLPAARQAALLNPEAVMRAWALRRWALRRWAGPARPCSTARSHDY